MLADLSGGIIPLFKEIFAKKECYENWKQAHAIREGAIT